MLLVNIGAYLLDYSFMQNVAIPAYIAFLARTQVYPTIKFTLNGIRTLYETRGQPNPLIGHWGISHLLQGLKRKKPGGIKQKFPITIGILETIASATDPTNPAEVAFTAACLVAFFAFLRKSNVTTDKVQSDDMLKALTADNVYVDYSTYTLWIRLTCTKTIQFGERVLLIPIAGIRGSTIDPVAMWLRHIQLSDLPRATGSHAFAYQTKRGGRWTNLTHTKFVTRLKKILTSVGIDSSKYASHSFRRGGATFAAACQVSSDMIKALGDWRSSAYQAYIAISGPMRAEAAQLMGAAAAKATRR